MRMIVSMALCAVISQALALERVEKPDLIEAASPFSEQGKVEKNEMRLHSRVEVSRVESGDLNGVKYRFWYADGSGTFAGTRGNSLSLTERTQSNWATRCVKDAMNDSVRCMATTRDLTLSVRKDGSYFVVIGSDHYPGTDVAIRIGKSIPVTASSEVQFRPPKSSQLLEQMRNGVTITTRYQEWPYKEYRDSTFELYGFDEVRSYLQWAVKNIN